MAGWVMEEDNKILDRYIGLRIRERRKTLGLTQADLAALLSISHQQIQRYESGENTLSMVRLLDIAHCLTIKPEYFYENAPLPDRGRVVEQDIVPLKPLNRPMRLLLVEDTYSDELLFRKAVEKSAVPVEITVISEPEKVMDFLEYNSDRDTKPDLLILDINMPRLNGIALLKIIKGRAELKSLPVIMLTNSIRSKDMRDSYDNFANGYVQKNSDLLEFFEDMDLILQYWSRAIILPNAA